MSTVRVRHISGVLLLAALGGVANVRAQVPQDSTSRKQARAFHVSNDAVRLDGRLDEAVWSQAPPVYDFVQKEPTEGGSPSDRIEVKFLFDDDALYVGARMWSRAPSAIQAPLSRRDSVAQAERFFVALDTYLDHRTAYGFGVTASGVRIDTFYASDNADTEDPGFDPVWEARASVDSTGWTAELWIPFSQLRFSESAQQVWGLNVGRLIPTSNEEDYWVAIPRTQTAWASRFGELRGLDGIRPRRRLEVLPYVSSGATMNGDRDLANPFDDGRNMTAHTGADAKVGLGSNLTLDLTVNPDFGQVEADPAEVNLTAFETIFPEKRPFFTEGAGLMNLAVSSGFNLFNSRRIGARPLGPASGDYVDYPQVSTILSAAKVTGRTSRGTSIGALAALTGEESARVVHLSTPGITRVRVAPRSTYAVGRVQQEFGRAGSTASVMYSGVHRDLASGDALATVLSRNAFGLGSDATIRLNGGEYELTLLGMYTRVDGDAGAVERIQRTSAHYFQRPDRRNNRLDPLRTSLTGYKWIAGIERKSGRHWLWDASTRTISPGMESNDMGRVNSGDGINYSADLRYRETRPGRVFRNYSLNVNSGAEWDFDHDLIGRSLRPSVSVGFKNFWTATFSATRSFRFVDLALTRGGPLMQRPAAWSTTSGIANRASSQTRWSGSATISRNEDGGRTNKLSGSFSFRPGPRWQLSVDPSLDHTTDAQQYVSTLSGGGQGTYGSRYVFAYIQRRTVAAEIRTGFTLKPDLNVDVYAEPFASSGRYYDYGELLHAGGRARLVYGAAGTSVALQSNGDRVVSTADGSFLLANRDFNLRSLHSNVVLRWEWRPGSTFYLVWQQSRELRDATGSPAGFGDALRAFASPGSHFLSVKTTFWMPF